MKGKVAPLSSPLRTLIREGFFYENILKNLPRGLPRGQGLAECLIDLNSMKK